MVVFQATHNSGIRMTFRWLAVFTLALPLGAAQCIVTVVGAVNIEGGPATSMSLWAPFSVVPDGSGGIFVADYGANAIRYVNATGSIITIAGTYRAQGGKNWPSSDWCS